MHKYVCIEDNLRLLLISPVESPKEGSGDNTDPGEAAGLGMTW